MIRSELILFCILAMIFLSNVTAYIKAGDKHRDLTMVERSLKPSKESLSLDGFVDWLKK